jgi:hypothetical protein
MGFDAEGYRKAAKAAGISDDDIEKDIAEEMGNIKPVNAAPQKSDVQIGGEYDWLLPAAIGTGVGVAATGLGLAGKKIRDRLMKQPAEIDRTIDIPMDVAPTTPAPTQEPPPKPMLSERDMEMIRQSEANKAAKEAEAAVKAQPPVAAPEPVKPVVGDITPVAPYDQGRMAGIMANQEMANPLGGQASAYGEPLRPVAPPEAPAVEPPVPEAPKVEAPPPAATSAETETTAAKKRGPKTAEQKAAIDQKLQQEIANAPEGRLPSAPNPKKTNKLLPTDVIGQGGWHWYQGQMGPEAEENWLRQFGRTNQSYVDAKQAVKEGRLPGPVVTEGKKGGAFPRQTTVPNYIKGAVAPGALAPLAALAGALGIAATPDAQAAMQRAAGAIKDIGVSPDIMQGKAEELGRLGNAYITAGNPQYRAQLEAQMSKETDSARYKQLMEEYKKAGGNVAGGRGVAPPAAYMR